MTNPSNLLQRAAELKDQAGRTWGLRATDLERARAIMLANGVTEPSIVDGELRFAASEASGFTESCATTVSSTIHARRRASRIASSSLAAGR